MKKRQTLDITVGLFVLLGVIAVLVLAFKVSGATGMRGEKGYNVSAEFSNVGDLKVRAPVTIAGVKIGEVASIALEHGTFTAQVTLHIDSAVNKIPASDTAAQILTQGLLGSNYVSILPGFENDGSANAAPQYLHEGSAIHKTQPAIILENLIGQLIFNINK